MLKAIVFGVVIIILGLFIALGPQFIFQVCGSTITSSEVIVDCCTVFEISSCCVPDVGRLAICYWTARAEIGIGLLIVALGTCMLVFADRKIHFGLAIGTLFSSIIAWAVPNLLIGGCSSLVMRCHKVAFPALTVVSVVLFIFSVIIIFILQKQQNR